MDFQPKTESGSPHPFASGIAADDTTYMNMSISELIWKLRAAEAVKSRLNGEVEEKKREINSLKERVKFETLDKRRVEVELKQRCKKGKEAEERYEELLGVLRTHNRELGEELKKCKQQCEEGKKAEERYEKLLEAAKKMEQEHGSTIAELRSMIRKLEDENRKHEDIWKRKFGEFNERVSRLGNDIELLKNGGETNVVHVHGRQFGDISGGIGQSPRNPNKGASEDEWESLLMREQDLVGRTEDATRALVAVHEELVKYKEELVICEGKLAESACRESKFAEERVRLVEELRKAYIRGWVHDTKDCAMTCIDLGFDCSFSEIIDHFCYLQSQPLNVL